MSDFEPLRNDGYCHCCRSTTTFEIRGPWLRDEYVCLSCGSIPRQRHLQHVLDRFVGGWEQVSIHESSPGNDLIARWCRGYSYSHLLPDTVPGSLRNGVRCENLERLTFADGSFDLFITQDVLEHVFEPALAVREIMRVLRPGGRHVFTAPKHRGVRRSSARAQRIDGRVVHLLEEQYHGNPVGDGRALVTWEYGDDFECLLSAWTGHPLTTYVTRDRALGIDAEFIEVFVMQK